MADEAKADALAEAEKIMSNFTDLQRIIQTPLEERAYMLQLASTWTMLELARTLRKMQMQSRYSR